MPTLADSTAASGRAGKHGIAEMLQTYRPGSKTMVVVMCAVHSNPNRSPGPNPQHLAPSPYP